MYSAGMVPGSAYPGRGLHRPGTRNATFQNYSHFYGVNSCGQWLKGVGWESDIGTAAKKSSTTEDGETSPLCLVIYVC